VWAVQSAAANTPVAKKRRYRQIKRLTKAQRYARTPAIPWWATYEIPIARKPGGYLYASSREQAQKFAIPEYRGLARGAWWAALSKARKAARGSVDSLRIRDAAMRLSAGYMTAATENPRLAIGFSVTNQVDYVAKIAPQIAERATIMAANRLTALWVRQVSGELKRGYFA
jgi:hypothetical protein